MTPTKLLIGQILVVFTIVIAGVWFATQWTAAMLGYQPELGSPWFDLAGLPVYRPWSLFPWWFHFEAYAPKVFDRAGAIAAASGFIGCAAAVAGSLWRARQARHVTTYGSARWATPSEIRRAGLFGDAGVFLGRLHDRYLRHDGPEHVLAFAPTRSGKGVGLVVPTLLSWTGSAVIHDIKGENWQLTAGWRSRFSHCLLFNPTDLNSARYNPLLEVRRGEQEVRDVQNIADILVDPEGALERRNHWEKTSHALLVGAILHILYADEEKTLARVATFLSDPQRPFVDTLRRMMTTNHIGTRQEPRVHPVVASAAREVLNKSDNERSGVLSTAMSFLGLYRDPTVAEITSRCDWRIADLVDGEHPVSLYLVIPPSDISRTKPLVRLVLNQIGRRLTEQLETASALEPPPVVETTRSIRAIVDRFARAFRHKIARVKADVARVRSRFARLLVWRRSDAAGAAAGGTRQERRDGRQRLLIMLDEFPALGRLDFFETALAFMAGYGIRAFLIAQSLNQIVKAYGENNSILDNCHVRIAFATNDERTARRISDALGTATEQRAMRNYAGHRLAPWLAHVMVSRQETSRPLLTTGEIMQLPPADELVLASGLAPIKAKKLRYFEDVNFRARVAPPPVLGGGTYADRPKPRSIDWASSVREPDARLAKDANMPKPDEDEGGRQQQRHPGLAEKRPAKPVKPKQLVLLGLDRDDDDPASAKRAMDRARSLATVVRGHAINQRDGRDPLPGM